MDALPAEIKLEILCALTDIPTLCSLIQASTQMFRVFFSAQPLVLSNVLQNEIPVDVQPDAEEVYISSTMPWYPSTSLRSASIVSKEQRLLGFGQSRIIATLPAAICLSQMHSLVVFFTTEYCTTLLLQDSISNLPDPNQWPPSGIEVHRLNRAFYRLELYCNLSRHRRGLHDHKYLSEYEIEVDSPSGQIIQSLRAMPSWEFDHREFILCYSFERMFTPYRQVVLHDVLYGVHMIEVCLRRIHPDPRDVDILSSGLEKVRNRLPSTAYGTFKELVVKLTAAPALASTFDALIRPAKRQSLLGHHQWKADLKEWASSVWDHSKLAVWSLFAKPGNPKLAQLRQARIYHRERKNQRGLMWAGKRRANVFQHGGGQDASLTAWPSPNASHP